MKQFICSLDFSSLNSERYLGYAEDNTSVYFSKLQALYLTDYYNTMSKKYPKAGFDRFRWKGEVLYMHNYATTGYFKIECKEIEYMGIKFTGYQIGGRDWTWETIEFPEKYTDVDKLAYVYTSIIRSECCLQMETIVSRNNNEYKNQHCCATHDFCDANQVYLDAYEILHLKECDYNEEKNMTAGLAMNLAKAHNFEFTQL